LASCGEGGIEGSQSHVVKKMGIACRSRCFEQAIGGIHDGIDITALAAIARVRPPERQVDHDQRRTLAEAYAACPTSLHILFAQCGQMTP
jgi:hypothetical protein